MSLAATRQAISMPVSGYGYRLTGMSTGANAFTITDEGVDPSYTPNGCIVVQVVGTAGSEAQTVFANWQAGTLTNNGSGFNITIWASSGADIAYVDILIYAGPSPGAVL
ncbi:MAG TPA: hypothetical protein VMT89_14745 [Candidatus Acidoferrales bacterium]|nr:hypothetical protein [Candidatus Acidoferrales bacterium]